MGTKTIRQSIIPRNPPIMAKIIISAGMSTSDICLKTFIELSMPLSIAPVAFIIPNEPPKTKTINITDAASTMPCGTACNTPKSDTGVLSITAYEPACTRVLPVASSTYLSNEPAGSI